MPRPTDAELDTQEDALYSQMTGARERVLAATADEASVRRAAIVAHFAAALASLRSIPRGAK